ncbi:MAG: hypothetical protein K2W82_19705 [Candidatus Obscuribacterales bacterium]|nr:hypothetical protein [Candidatus Obscuribacterales bacterium]
MNHSPSLKLNLPVLFSLSVVMLSGCAANKHQLTDADLNDPAKVLGKPIDGLNSSQLNKYWQGEALFKKEFTPEEGLGPLFNGKSCFECHGQPLVVGGEGRDNSSTSIMNYARRVPGSEKAKKPLKEVIQGLRKIDVDFFLTQGGPSLQKRTITTEFPAKFPFECQIDAERMPIDAELQSNRHSPPLFGDGLIDQIPDGLIAQQALEERATNPALAGTPISAVDRYFESARAGRFGWKNQHVNMFNFTTGALNIEVGLTTYANNTENSSDPLGDNPTCIRAFNKVGNPNDKGKILLALTYFQSLLAPPPRGPINDQVKAGEKIFEKLDCAFCHRPTWKTGPKVMLPDPDSPLPLINYIEIKPMENVEFHPYTDFLVHDMGPELADGIPQEGARGGEWRTVPLWGLRFKKFLLHDGRTRDIHEAILMHGGQGEDSAKRYQELNSKDKEALLAFLKSL